MTIRIEPFDPHTASDELWAAFNATRRAIAVELWPDEPVLDDAETRREVQTTNPMVEFRRWVAMEGDEVAGSIRAAFRRPGTANEEDYARFLWAGGGVRASSRRRGVGTLLLREVHCLMHTLDKTVLTMTTHAASGHAFGSDDAVSGLERFSRFKISKRPEQDRRGCGGQGSNSTACGRGLTPP